MGTSSTPPQQHARSGPGEGPGPKMHVHPCCRLTPVSDWKMHVHPCCRLTPVSDWKMHVHPCCRLTPVSDKRYDFLQDLRHWHIHDLDIHPSGSTLITSMICSWICGTAPGAPVKHHTPEQARSCFSCTLLGYSSTRLASQQRDDQVHQAHLLRQRCTMSF